MIKRKRASLWLLGSLLLVATGTLWLWIRLPGLVERRLVHAIHDLGFSEVHLNVRSVGLHHLDLASVFIGTSRAEGVSVASLILDFRLRDLKRGRIARLAAAGVALTLTGDSGGLRPVGLAPLFSGPGGQGALVLERLEVTGATATLRGSGGTLPIPFELEWRRRPGQNQTVLTARLFPRGERVTVSGHLDLDHGDGTLTATAARARALAFLPPLPPPLPQLLRLEMGLAGRIDLRGWVPAGAFLTLTTGTLEFAWNHAVIGGTAALACGFDDRWRPGNIRLKLAMTQLSGTGWRADLPLRLEARGTSPDELRLSLAPWALAAPAPLQIERLTARLTRQGERASLSGDIAATLPLDGAARLVPGASGRGSLRATGRFKLTLGPHRVEWQANGRVDGRSLQVARESLRGGLDRLSCTLRLAGQGKSLSATGALRGTGGSFAAAGLAGHDLAFTLPFRLDAGPAGARLAPPVSPAGTFVLPVLRLGETDLGSLAGPVALTGQGLTVAATLKPPAPMPVLTLDGTLRPSGEITVAYRIPPTSLRRQDGLDRLLPALKGYSVTGTLYGEGELVFRDGTWLSPASFRLSGGEFTTPGGSLAISGIEAGLRLADLWTLRSEQSQHLTFSRLKMGDVQIDDGRLAISLEGPQSLFLEAGEFRYSRGRVTILPFRFPFGAAEFAVTLYADRLRFDDTINQLMGEPAAAGDAELNGLLTLVIRDGLPTFRSGHLYSTPGMRGNLRLKRGSVVTGGMVLVEEAMSDFNYEWVRVTLESTGDKLDLTAFIQGAPAGKLPLLYDAGQRDFVRDPAGRRAVELKGLLLELRFREIDLRRLLAGGTRLTRTPR